MGDRRGIEPFELSHQSSVKILGIHRKPRKAPVRKKPLQRSSSRPKIQEGAARMERKGKQTALRERGVRRPRTGAKDARLAIKRCYAWNSFKIQEFSLENSKISENFNIF